MNLNQLKNLSHNNYALDVSKQSFTIVEVKDKDAISQSIESILLTSKGERVLFPTFGSELNASIFKSLTPETGEKLLTYIINLIKTWEKRIYIDENKCSMSINVQNQTLTIDIVYYLLSDGSNGRFNRKIIF